MADLSPAVKGHVQSLAATSLALGLDDCSDTRYQFVPAFSNTLSTKIKHSLSLQRCSNVCGVLSPVYTAPKPEVDSNRDSDHVMQVDRAIRIAI